MGAHEESRVNNIIDMPNPDAKSPPEQKPSAKDQKPVRIDPTGAEGVPMLYEALSDAMSAVAAVFAPFMNRHPMFGDYYTKITNNIEVASLFVDRACVFITNPERIPALPQRPTEEKAKETPDDSAKQ